MTLEEAIELVCYGDWLNILMPHLGDDDINRLAEAMCIIGNALCPVSREQVEKVWRGELGEWYFDEFCGEYKDCLKCGARNELPANFCRNCGALLTDEAVEMVMERLNKREETKK